MAIKIVKVANEDRVCYSGINPLYGFVKLPGILLGTKGFWVCPIEYIGEGRGEPNYEVLAFPGMHFDGESLHSILASTLAELKDRLAGEVLVPCGKDC